MSVRRGPAAGRAVQVLHRAAALLLVVTLAGCSLFGQKGGVQGKPEVDRFEMNARVAVRFGTDGYTGNLRWRHTQARDTVDIFTPVGTLYARLVRDAGGAVIEMADGKRDSDTDAGTLSRRVLGWELPLDAMPYWVFSRPSPGAEPERFDVSPEGRPALLQQGGWRVKYQTFFEDAAHVLPEKLELDRAGLKVKLIVSRWGQPAAAP